MRQAIQHQLGQQLDALGTGHLTERVDELTRTNQRLEGSLQQATEDNHELHPREDPGNRPGRSTHQPATDDPRGEHKPLKKPPRARCRRYSPIQETLLLGPLHSEFGECGALVGGEFVAAGLGIR